MFIVAEYWSFETEKLQEYVHQVEGKTMLFDAPLHMNFHQASTAGSAYDMSQIFANSLVVADPWHAVTIVANHDTQPLQSLEAPVEAWFKPLAYALILLREQGVPTIFYPDLFGATYEDEGGDGEKHKIEMPVIPELEGLIRARQQYGWGVQTDYFDHPNCVAFSRSGTETQPGCVVIMSNGDAGEKSVPMGEGFAGKVWRDHLGNREETITADEHGTAVFVCNGGSVSVWVVAE
jgi:alpha-amylase